MKRQSYASDLSEAQWARVEGLLPRHGGNGERDRLAKYARQRTVETMLYLERRGCQWRNLPHDFPPWHSVWELFSRWRDPGGPRAGAHGLVRRVPGTGGPSGRQRHLLVDTDGLLLACHVHPANV